MKTKKWIKGLLCMALVLCTVFGMCPVRASAANVFTAKIKVQYGQSDARSVLQYINRYRSTNLCYDYQLEKAAMQRAAEIVVYNSHDKPDGSDYASGIGFTTGYRGECLSFGRPTAAITVDALLHSTSGHRDILLDSRLKYVGVGHVVVNGYDYWALMFSAKPSGKGSCTAKNGSSSVSVRISRSLVPVQLSLEKSQISVVQGQSVRLPRADLVVDTMTWSSLHVPVAVNWSSCNSSVAQINGGQVKGVGTGSATLKAKLSNGTTASCKLTSKTNPFLRANVTFAQSSVIFNGKEQKPKVTMKVDGKVLQAGRDYSITYQNNIKVGTATATINGKGAYFGTIRKSFKIMAAQPSITGLTNVKGGIKVSWGKAAGAVKYRMFVRDAAGKWTALDDTTGTCLTVRKINGAALKPGQRYTFTVRCITADGASYTSSFDTKGKQVVFQKVG